ncbi:MAG TPA: RNA methyltransferase [Bryobacteraceae bacterium]|nr:RNA methyltransferase [Bryobacteraceae bacterium]
MTGIETVTSAANPLLKDIRRVSARGGLTADGFWIAEGFHLLEEAWRSQCAIPIVLVSESSRPRLEQRAARTIVLPDKLFQSIATTETSQGVMALVRPPSWRMEQLFEGSSLVVVLDGIQDPGNAGAILRAAEAFGATGAVFVKGTVSPWHPKTLRASAGSLFRVPFVAAVDALETGAALVARGVEIYAAMPFTGSERMAGDVDFTRPCAIAIGSEGRGVGDELRSIARPVAIPTLGVESLNAAMAASILLYEMRRQRVREAVRA